MAGNTAGTSPLLVNSGGTSGLTLFYEGTGSVNVTDNNKENILLNEMFLESSFGTSFTLTANGSIYTTHPTYDGIIFGGDISLTAIGGNIAANIGGTAPLLLNTGGTGNGLILSAQATQVGGVGGIVNISDTEEGVTIDNSTSASSATVSFTLLATAISALQAVAPPSAVPVFH